MGVNAGEHIDFLILLIEERLEFSDLGLQASYSLLQRFGVSTRKGSPTELVARLAFEADVDALCAAPDCSISILESKHPYEVLRSNAITANLLGPATVAV
jgi:hypothetical protein